MSVEEIRARIKDIIQNVTSIPAAQIGDNDSFRKNLDLDSLSLLEIGVDVDYAFKLGLPEEELQGIDCVEESVSLVTRMMAGREAHAGAA